MTADVDTRPVSKGEPIELLPALKIIKAAITKNGLDSPTPTPTKLDRNKIARMVSVFQPRSLDGKFYEDEKHIKVLQDAIGKTDTPNYLHRLTVWWGGDRYYVVDGHHRLDAYRRVGVTKGIPVQVFQGTLEDAMAHAAEENSKDRLPMSKDDKLNMAWKLIVLTNKSKAEVKRACAISIGTVTNMRSAKARLEELGKARDDLAVMTWHDVQDELSNRGKTEFDPDEALKRRAETYRSRLYKTFGSTPGKDPEAFALALLLSNTPLPKMLMQSESWEDSLYEFLEELADQRVEAARAKRIIDEDADY